MPTTTSTASSSAGRFMVNIGSYANAANAAQLESSLRAAGLTVRAEVVTVDGKSARRLRLGPFASRALAETARIKAKTVRADIPASVIEVDDSPAADAPARSSAAAGTSASAFALQLAVLSDEAKANTQRDSLRAAGFAAFVEKLQTDKGMVYRLRVGPEADRADAEKIRAAVKKRFGHDAIIVDYR
jgi:DedD protein